MIGYHTGMIPVKFFVISSTMYCYFVGSFPAPLHLSHWLSEIHPTVPLHEYRILDFFFTLLVFFMRLLPSFLSLYGEGFSFPGLAVLYNDLTQSPPPPSIPAIISNSHPPSNATPIVKSSTTDIVNCPCPGLNG
ncbi:hypothetical protein AAG906_013365 [Vitis piasezkii]